MAEACAADELASADELVGAAGGRGRAHLRAGRRRRVAAAGVGLARADRGSRAGRPGHPADVTRKRFQPGRRRVRHRPHLTGDAPHRWPPSPRATSRSSASAPAPAHGLQACPGESDGRPRQGGRPPPRARASPRPRSGSGGCPRGPGRQLHPPGRARGRPHPRSTARRTSVRADGAIPGSWCTISRSRSAGLDPTYVDVEPDPRPGAGSEEGRPAGGRGHPEEAGAHPAPESWTANSASGTRRCA